MRRRLRQRVGLLGHGLKPHLRSPDQPKTKIDVVYGDAKGTLEAGAKALRSIKLLKTVAERLADALFGRPFTLEMKSCGFPNAQSIHR